YLATRLSRRPASRQLRNRNPHPRRLLPEPLKRLRSQPRRKLQISLTACELKGHRNRFHILCICMLLCLFFLLFLLFLLLLIIIIINMPQNPLHRPPPLQHKPLHPPHPRLPPPPALLHNHSILPPSTHLPAPRNMLMLGPPEDIAQVVARAHVTRRARAGLVARRVLEEAAVACAAEDGVVFLCGGRGGGEGVDGLAVEAAEGGGDAGEGGGFWVGLGFLGFERGRGARGGGLAYDDGWGWGVVGVFLVFSGHGGGNLG
ncbi:hypothetical protein BS50DRAFT_652368, partial [Corynespora cassiicola Philippines]